MKNWTHEKQIEKQNKYLKKWKMENIENIGNIGNACNLLPESIKSVSAREACFQPGICPKIIFKKKLKNEKHTGFNLVGFSIQNP